MYENAFHFQDTEVEIHVLLVSKTRVAISYSLIAPVIDCSSRDMHVEYVVVVFE